MCDHLGVAGKPVKPSRERAILLLQSGALAEAVKLWESLHRADPGDVGALYGLLHALADPDRASPLDAPARAVELALEIVERTPGQPRWSRERKFTCYWLARAAAAGHPALAGAPRAAWIGWLDEARALASRFDDSHDREITLLAIRVRRGGGAAERAEARAMLLELLGRLNTRMPAYALAEATVDLRADASDLGVALPEIPRSPEPLPVEADVAALAAAAEGAVLREILPHRWEHGPEEFDTRDAGAPWLSRVFACAGRSDHALQAMAAIRAAEWRLGEYEPAIRSLALARRDPPSRFLVDLALASARLLPSGARAWHEVPLDPTKEDPVRAAATLSARLYLCPNDPTTYLDVRTLWDRARTGVVTASYADGSVFFGPSLALRMRGVSPPRPFADEIMSVVDREIEGTRAEGRDELALWRIFGALDPRYDQGAAR